MAMLSCRRGQGRPRCRRSSRERGLANLRCIEAGFVDLCRLIYHGHDCIRHKTLSLQQWGRKESELNSSHLPSQLCPHCIIPKRKEKKLALSRIKVAPSNAEVSLYVLIIIHNINNYVIYWAVCIEWLKKLNNDIVFAILDAAHLPTDQWRP